MVGAATVSVMVTVTCVVVVTVIGVGQLLPDWIGPAEILTGMIGGMLKVGMDMPVPVPVGP